MPKLLFRMVDSLCTLEVRAPLPLPLLLCMDASEESTPLT